MRIAWCTPFSEQSAIGRVSAIVAEELVRRPEVQIDIWQPVESTGRVWSGETYTIDLEDLSPLLEYDAVVYHLGNYAPNHLDIWKASEQVPGIVVLHDISLGGLFHQYLLDRGDYSDEIGRWYGHGVENLARRVLGGSGETPPWELDGGAAFSFLGLAARNARTVVVHSQFAAREVETSVLADVVVVGLPVEGAEPEDDIAAALPALIPEGVPLVLQAGIMNPNKRIDVVVEAFADVVSRRRAHLVVAGRAGGLSSSDVENLLAAQGIVDATVLDDPSDAMLAKLRANAAVAVVLREPCLEGASYALLESLVAGVPVVTVDDGSYAEVHGTFIQHVPTPPRAQSVSDAIVRSLDDAGQEVRESAQSFVAQGHTARDYADGIIEVVRRDLGVGPRLQLLDELTLRLRRMGLSENDEAIGRVADRVDFLYSATPRVLSAEAVTDEVSLA
ncbi:glycosyltransferase [Oerskovia gallyi]|uniref:Glycosyltransferase family 4 protein n=1 Tax=Oerskovia gallyi TaxID=2762226 RepID=A0ABR8V532_9CELL|nr:glycosyltransferase [Oerskovia gallyi]MBD7999897.1 glycosyltransferase family 4 protein [Oerskovia gallyi]